jgi:hypothetical protein
MISAKRRKRDAQNKSNSKRTAEDNDKNDSTDHTDDDEPTVGGLTLDADLLRNDDYDDASDDDESGSTICLCPLTVARSDSAELPERGRFDAFHDHFEAYTMSADESTASVCAHGRVDMPINGVDVEYTPRRVDAFALYPLDGTIAAAFHPILLKHMKWKKHRTPVGNAVLEVWQRAERTYG